jgi:hypothetical protein
MLDYWLPGLVALGVGLAAAGFYRIYLHPLAKFPGPKLAALSHWYEAYYDVLKKGKYTFEIGRMHQKYGKHNISLLPCWKGLWHRSTAWSTTHVNHDAFIPSGCHRRSLDMPL